MMDCDFSTGVCPDCGEKGPPGLKRNCPAKDRPGLGDRAEQLLTTFGITQERYIEAKAWLLGKMPEEVTCNCPERRDWLNRVGSEIRRLFG